MRFIFSCIRNQSFIITLYHFKTLSRNCYGKNHQLQDDVANYLSSEHGDIIYSVQKHFKVHVNFISEDEEMNLMKEVDPIFKRRRYQFDHWDGAIEGYRETEKLKWNDGNNSILQRVRDLAFPHNTVPIKQIHVLDLAKNGYIKPHVDSIRFCGDTIAGLSLLSSSVMRLVSEKNKNYFVDCFLPRRSLYIMKGVARYEFTHEILSEKSSYFKGDFVARDRRVSIICRNEPSTENLS